MTDIRKAAFALSLILSNIRKEEVHINEKYFKDTENGVSVNICEFCEQTGMTLTEVKNAINKFFLIYSYKPEVKKEQNHAELKL